MENINNNLNHLNKAQTKKILFQLDSKLVSVLSNKNHNKEVMKKINSKSNNTSNNYSITNKHLNIIDKKIDNNNNIIFQETTPKSFKSNNKPNFYLYTLKKQVKKLKEENTFLKSKVSIQQEELSKLNNVLESIIKSQFTKLDLNKHLNRMNYNFKEKIIKLEKDLKNKTEKNKTLTNTLNTYMGVPLTSDNNKKELGNKNKLKKSVLSKTNFNTNSINNDNLSYRQTIKENDINSYILQENKYAKKLNINNDIKSTINENTFYFKEKAFLKYLQNNAIKTYDNSYSLISLFNRSQSVLYFNNNTIKDFINSENILFLNKLLLSNESMFFNYFSNNNNNNNSEKEELIEKVFVLIKGLYNDFLSNISLIHKMKLLVNYKLMFNSNIMLNDIINQSETAISEILNCDHTLIFILNNKNKEAVCSINGKRLVLKFNNTLISHLISNKTLINIKDVSIDVRFNLDEIESFISNNKIKIKNIIAIPIIIDKSNTRNLNLKEQNKKSLIEIKEDNIKDSDLLIKKNIITNTNVNSIEDSPNYKKDKTDKFSTITKDNNVFSIALSLNKKSNIDLNNYFDINDEHILKLFSVHLKDSLISSFSYSERLSNELKIKMVLTNIKDIYASNSIEDLLRLSMDIIKKLFMTDKAQIIAIEHSSIDFSDNVLKINNNNYTNTNTIFNFINNNNCSFCRFDYFYSKIKDNNLKGILGKAFSEYKCIYSYRPFLDPDFNANYDIDTSSPIVTIPLIYKKHYPLMLGAIQFEYNNENFNSILNLKTNDNDINYFSKTYNNDDNGLSRLDSDIIDILLDNVCNKLISLLSKK